MILIEKIQSLLAQRKQRSIDRQLLEEYFLLFNDWPGIPVRRSINNGLLVYSMTNWHLQIQQELLFAYLAELSGCTVYLAGYPLAEKYWRQMGFAEDRFLDWKKVHLNHSEKATLIAEQAIGEICNSNELREFKYDGLPIGKHVLSAIGRKKFRAGVDIDNKEIREIAKELLSTTIGNVFSIREIMGEYKITQVLLNEANYTNAGVSQEVLRNGGKFIQYVHSYEEGVFVFKRYGMNNMSVHPLSLSDKSWEILKNKKKDPLMDQKIQKINDEKYSSRFSLSRRIGLDLPAESPKALRKRLGLDNGNKIAVIFSHVLWDANMFWGEDLFPGGAEEWLVETVRLAIQNTKMNWVVKIHPANVWKMKTKGVQVTYNDVKALEEKIGTLPQNVHILLPEQKVNPRSLFNITDVGLTIRGTVGMELPALGIPVLTAGTGRYSNKGFTIDPEDIEEYKKYILSLHLVGKLSAEEIDLAKRFFFGVFVQRPWRSSLYTSSFDSIDPLKSCIRLTSWKHYAKSDQLLSDYLLNPELDDYLCDRSLVNKEEGGRSGTD